MRFVIESYCNACSCVLHMLLVLLLHSICYLNFVCFCRCHFLWGDKDDYYNARITACTVVQAVV